jgi:hypothetical protein
MHGLGATGWDELEGLRFLVSKPALHRCGTGGVENAQRVMQNNLQRSNRFVVGLARQRLRETCS